MLNFVKCFFLIEMIIWLLHFVMWCITLFNLLILNDPCIPGKCHSCSGCMMLLMYCWLWLLIFCWEYLYICSWQPNPVLLPGEFHGQRSLAGYSPWGCKESDLTEWLMLSLFTFIRDTGLWFFFLSFYFCGSLFLILVSG